MKTTRYLERLLRLGLVLGLLAGLFFLTPPLPVSGSNGDSPGSPDFAPDHILVKFKAGTSETTRQDTHRRHQGSVEREVSQIGVQVVRVPRGQVLRKVNDYRGERAVEYAEPDYVVRKVETPDDPSFSLQWGMARIMAPEAWDITAGSSAVRIAILDTGIDQDHEDLLGKIVANKNFTSSPTVDDLDGHGTHVAGTAAAATNNSIGVAGVGRDSRLMNGKVLGDTGSGLWSWVAAGITWAVDPDGDPSTDDGAKVINMSLGGPNPSDTVRDAINTAWSSGVVLVAAAGNSGGTLPVYPAYYANVIAVAATDQNDARATFSTYGNWVDVAAPGVDIFSTFPNQTYGSLSGTSMAAPHVAGLAALVWASQWGATSDNALIRARIERLSDPVGSFVAYGRINAFAAVGSTPTPTLESIAVTPSTASIEVGFTQQFTARGTFSGGMTADLTATAIWASSNISVATINASGLATGVAEGTTDITASQDGVVSNSASLTVTPQTSAPRIFADGFETGIVPPWDFAWPTSGASRIEASTEQQKEGSYSARATLAAGGRAALAYEVLPQTYGTLYLRAYIYVGNYDTTDSSTSEMIVIEEPQVFKVFVGLRDFGSPPWPLYLVVPGNSPVAIPGASIAPGTWYSVELAAYRSGTQGWVRVWVNNGDANSPSLVWTGNTGSGGFNRVRVGFYGPSASTSTVAYWDSVVVAESFIGPLQEGPPPTLVSIAVEPGTASIQQGATQQFTATGTFSNGSTADLTNTATWTSSDTLVATINASGLATGVAEGTTDITASQDGVLSNSATLTVTPPPPLVSIAVAPSSASIPQGATQQFTATGTFSDGSTADLTTTATWASSDTLVATINASGLATGVAEGTAGITASQDGVLSNSATLTVTPPPPPPPNIFADGFESGSLAAWTASWVSSGASSVAASPEQQREGSYSGKATLAVNDNAALLYKDLPQTYGTLYMRAYIYVDNYDTTDSSTSEMLVLGAGTSKIFVGLRDFGSPPWPLYLVYGGNIVAVPGVSIVPGTWYSVELAAYRSSTEGWIKVWVNNGDANNPNLVWTGNTGTGGFSRVRVGFFGPRASTATVAYWDAVVVAESFVGPLPDGP